MPIEIPLDRQRRVRTLQFLDDWATFLATIQLVFERTPHCLAKLSRHRPGVAYQESDHKLLRRAFVFEVESQIARFIKIDDHSLPSFAATHYIPSSRRTLQ